MAKKSKKKDTRRKRSTEQVMTIGGAGVSSDVSLGSKLGKK
jgi:hypothetical protein